ncbi:MAG: alpha/beta fold hydrolase [Solirubrobacteraceae bacterium]
MRAREPDRTGYVVRDGVRIYFEVFGEAREPAILLMPTWAIFDSQHWKMQVPYLARHFRVITFDPRGNGRSDRPADVNGYGPDLIALDALAVLDETGTEHAIVAGLCPGVRYSVLLALKAPERVAGLVAIAPGLPGLGPAPPYKTPHLFNERLDSYDGWTKFNRHYLEQDWAGFARWHAEEMVPEPHSSKAVDDMVEWSLQTDARTMLIDIDAPGGPMPADEEFPALCASLACPVLVIHGDQDTCQPVARGRRMAELTGGELLELHGAGHVPHARHPVAVNHAIAGFAERIRPRPRPPTTWMFAPTRKRRALWVCSPIGLGHALRDLAIARALRERVPDLEIHWWAQAPVTSVLEAEGEIIHPGSAELASESAHWESEAS